MANIGAAWMKENDKGYNINLSIEEALLPLTITKEKMLILKPNIKKSEAKQPDYYVDMFIPKKKNQNNYNNQQNNDDEILF